MPEPIASTEGESSGPNPLTRKIGPLPAWGWAVAIGGGFILLRIVTGKGAFPAASGSSTPVGAATVPGSESSLFGNLSASDIAALKAALAPTEPPSAPPPSGKTPDFAGTLTAFVNHGTRIRYPDTVHSLSDAIAWYFRALHNGAHPAYAFSTTPVK